MRDKSWWVRQVLYRNGARAIGDGLKVGIERPVDAWSRGSLTRVIHECGKKGRPPLWYKIVNPAEMNLTTSPSRKSRKRVAIVQSCYIPWKGYFDLINSVDEFILYDDVQYTRRDWRNRNRIKTQEGFKWLSIPVLVKGKYFQKTKDTIISDPDWNRRHWKTIAYCYSKAPYFKEYKKFFNNLYIAATDKYLSKTNRHFINKICELLDIQTKITWSMDYCLAEGKTERLVGLCLQAGATEYTSGPSAREYIEPELFESAGIRLEYVDYSGYPEYHQLNSPFVHEVSIIDLILNEGPNASQFMKSFGRDKVILNDD